MGNKRITELTQVTVPESGDVLPIVNSNETKKITFSDTTVAVRNSDTPLTASGITVGDGNIVPTTPQGATLGTIDKPFKDIFLQSGSISIESDTPGDPSAIISNKFGNLEISVGGMLLIQPDASFIAPTGSFSYLSGSFNHIGSANRLGDTIITGSVDITGSFETDLQESYIWVGDSNDRSQSVPVSSLTALYPFNFGLFNQTGSSVPISGSTAEESLIGGGVGSLSIPANGFQKGNSFHAILTGHCTFLNNNTLEIRIKAGDILLVDTGVLTLASSTNQHWKMDIYFTINELGPAGTASISTGGLFVYDEDQAGKFNGTNFSFENITTFDTTTENILNITAQFNNTGNSMYSQLFTLTRTF